MDGQLIISISREYGSGGRVIAEQIAKDFELPFYDRNILEEVAEEKGVKSEHLHAFDETPRNPLLTRRVRGHSSSMADAVAEMQFDYLRRLADSGKSFVVLGRCSEAVLRGREGLITVFVIGDWECKRARIMNLYDLNEEDAEAKMKRHDRHRRNYHNTYTDLRWGDSRGYDLCINSSALGIDGTTAMLEQYIRARAEHKGRQAL